jgi:hypothetical protein
MAWFQNNFGGGNWLASRWFRPGSGSFPTQHDGLLYWDGVVWKSLCLVAEADAAVGMGAAPLVEAAGVFYSPYVVETTDPNASPVFVETTTGWHSIRFKT